MASSFRWYNDEQELCQIINQTINENPNIIFILIIGNKHRVNPIKMVIKRNGIDHNTKILEQMPFSEMPNILNMCDILISHFNFHGVWPHNCSIKHLEYLAVGKPVIATNVGANTELVSDGQDGFVIPHSNINVMREKIETLLENDSTTDQFGRSAFNSAERYNIKLHLDKLEDLYHDLITEHEHS